MSRATALTAAVAAGISFAVENDRLVLDAHAAPPPGVVEEISRYKSEILDLLRSGFVIWSREEWQAFFDERAGIAEHDQGFDRLDAELIAFEDCVDHWLTMNPPLAEQYGQCLRCKFSVPPEEQASVPVTCCGGATGRLHIGCASDWTNLRRWDARTALIWLLHRTRTTQVKPVAGGG